jgi:thioredoxin-related protein
MEKKGLLILIPVLCLFSFAKVKHAEKEKINWLTVEELNSKMKSEPKPVIIDLYTNWCYWCKVMDKKTYTNPKVISYINEHFYAVKVNAETKEAVNWDNRKYDYNNKDRVNDFALYLTQGQLEFPNTVIFPDLQKTPAAIPGFMEPQEIEIILKYFGDEVYKQQNFTQYSANFKSTW